MVNTAAAITVVIILLFLMALKMRIGIAMAITGIIGILWLAGIKAFPMIGVQAFDYVNSFPFSALLLFIFLGELLFNFGIGGDLSKAAIRWLSWLPGGLAMAAVAACAGFGAISGSSMAGVATIGVNMLPELDKSGYDRKLAVGSVCAPAALATMIPPSLTFILYGGIAEVSIGKLFMAGVFTGILMAALMWGYIFIRVIRNPSLAPRVEAFSWRDRFISLRPIWAPVLLIVMILYGLYGGVASPTEIAGVACFLAIVIGLAMRRLNWQSMKLAVLHTARTAGLFGLILVGASIFNYALILTALPQWLVTTVIAQASILMVWLVVVGICFLLGLFMVSTAIVLIMAPLLNSIALGIGIDPILMGVVTVLMMEMAVITPPVGINLYVMQGLRKDMPFEDIVAGTLPFLIPEFLALILVIIFPQIALWLPGRMI